MKRFLLLWASLALALTSATAQEANIKVAAFLSQDKVAPGQTVRIAVVIDLAEPWHMNANPASQPEFIPTAVTLEPNDAVTFDKVTYPPGKTEKVTWSDDPVALYTGHIVIFTNAKITGAQPGPLTLKGTLRYQACNDQVCLAPKNVPFSVDTEIVPVGQPVQPVHPEIFGETRKTLQSIASPPSAKKPSNAIAQEMQTHGLLFTLVFVFISGLLLNLTPCVFPMIAITVSYFGAQGDRNLGKAFVSALIYFFGIVLTYSTLGLIAARTGGIFGSLLQSPVVLIGVAVLLVALALSMFGLYELQPPQFLMQKASGLSSKAGYVGLFFLGAVVGIVAAPCVGPILAALILYVAQTGDPWLGWWLFFFLSAGLGLPYVLLGTFPSLLKRLPKSGTWMVRVKIVLGILLLGVAVWFTNPLWYHETPGASPIAWQPYSAEAVAQAGKPIVIDFYATWCAPCKEMDRETYSDPRVVEQSKQFLMLKADLSTDSPATAKLTREFQIPGVPTTVFLDATGHEHAELRRSGFVSAEEFLNLMDQSLKPATTNAAANRATANIPPELMRPF